MLTNLSKHKTTISSPRLDKDLVKNSQIIFSGENITITINRVSLSIHIPARNKYQDTFEKTLNDYFDEFRVTVPRLVTLNFDSEFSRTTVLVVQDKRNRIQYLITKKGDIDQNVFETVSIVINSMTENIYTVKRFYNGKTDKKINLH